VSRGFPLLCAVGFLAYASYNLIRAPLLPLFATELGATPAQVGIVVAVSTLTGVVIKLPAGILSDLWGRRALLWVGLAAFALTPFAYLAVAALGVLVAVRVVHGLATAVFAPVAMALVADEFPARRGEALGWYSAATQAGKLFGPMLGGFLLVWAGYQFSFLVCGVLGLVILALFATADFGSTAATVTRSGDVVPRFLQGLRTVAGHPRLLLTAGMEAVQMFASGALMAFLPLYGTQVGLDPARIGLLFGAQGVVFVGVKPIMGRVSDRMGRVPLIVAGLLLAGATLALVPFTHRFWWLALLAAAFGLGEAVATSSTSALAADLVARKDTGSAMGIFGTIMDIGHAAGPIVTGVLIAAWGYGGAFGFVGVLTAAGAVAFGVVMRRPA
jgi:MFS family permease